MALRALQGVPDRAPISTDATAPVVRAIRDACVRSLWHELITYPKPGLVSLNDSGSHRDMDAVHFWRSTLALRCYFADAAAAGARSVCFNELRDLGVEAERRMLVATGGRNTHRGAIFNLGLLAAAAGYRATSNIDPAATLGECVQALWGVSLRSHRRDPCSHGARASRDHGSGGALAEAAAGYPSIDEIALPAYRDTLNRTGDCSLARLQAFFSLVARVDDTNLLHRGGSEGLDFARGAAASFIADGGVHATDWRRRAVAIHHAFVRRNLSPGGSADLLAGTLFVDAMQR